MPVQISVCDSAVCHKVPSIEDGYSLDKFISAKYDAFVFLELMRVHMEL